MEQISETRLRPDGWLVGRRLLAVLAVLAVCAAASGCGDGETDGADPDASTFDDVDASSSGADAASDAADAGDAGDSDADGLDDTDAGSDAAATDASESDALLPLCPVAQPLCGAAGQPALQDSFVASAGPVECVLSGDGGGSWSLVAPEGSLATLAVGDSGDTGTFDVDVAGTYTVALSVPDGDACRAAEARATVTSSAAAGLDVRVWWVTSGDADPDDRGAGAGAALDVYLAQGDDCWVGPQTCGGERGAPDWGAPGTGDDPRCLATDDAIGGGPVGALLAVPDAGETYRIGVHVREGAPDGVTASIRVYARGLRVYESLEVALPSGAWWEPATVTGAGSATVVERVSEGAPSCD
ncbi:MAG: hypothetical protein H6698_03725 [Myxococcales bacterium]|nr:hypothetical protein [Myxococcales bacterium]